MGDRRVRGAVVTAAFVLVAASGVAVELFDRRLRDIGREDLAGSGINVVAFLFALGSALVVGAALALRRRHPVGWLFVGLSCALAVGLPAHGYARYGAVADPGSLPAAGFVAVVDDGIFGVWFVLVALILHLTPTGRPLTRRWGRVAAGTAACGAAGFLARLVSDRDLQAPYESVTNPAALPVVGGALGPASSVLLIVASLGLIPAAASLVVRFRRSVGLERLQLLWLAVAALVAAPLLLASMVVAFTSNNQTALGLLAALIMSLVPVAAGLAISRYHLYDVPRILSRGLTWLLVSFVLGGTYAVVVVTTAQILRRVGSGIGGSSGAAAVLSTLAVVSVAGPVHRRVQNTVDRRFNRRRYDALRLVREHVRNPAPGTGIDEVLRGALGDPTVRVAYWIADRELWVDAEGRRVTPRAEDLDVERNGRAIAKVGFDPVEVEASLAEGAIAEATPELENANLRAAIGLQLVEVRESRARIATAQLAERRRIERNLHDGAQQRLLALALQLQAARVNGEAERLGATVDASIGELRAAVAELRELANGLHPSVLREGGLAAALDDLADRTPIPVALDVTDRRFDPEVEATAWFVVCEAVANAVKHGEPASIDAEVAAHDGTLVVVVRDDGRGGADPQGSGLRGIADRTEAVGGSLHVESGEQGTTVRAELPCGS